MKQFISYLLFFLIIALPVQGGEIDNGVILVYHHVSKDTPPSTSISPETFREHMDYLSRHHTVIPLDKMVESLRSGQQIEDKAVAITFDDGYRNILENGHPILKEYKFPYTIFVNPDQIGTRKDQLNWQQIQSMQKEGVLFANHTSTHNYLLKTLEGESEKDWLKRIENDIVKAENILQDKTGVSLKYLAYPFGEYNQKLTQKLQKMGYTGFGQHSGAIASHSDFLALPRFAAAGIYANLDTLKTKLNSLAMPVLERQRDNPQVTQAETQPVQVLTLNNSDFNMSQIGCFLNGSPLDVTVKENRLSMRPDSLLSEGRSRINCTAPSKHHKGRYYWYSQPWFMRQ